MLHWTSAFCSQGTKTQSFHRLSQQHVKQLHFMGKNDCFLQVMAEYSLRRHGWKRKTVLTVLITSKSLGKTGLQLVDEAVPFQPGRSLNVIPLEHFACGGNSALRLPLRLPLHCPASLKIVHQSHQRLVWWKWVISVKGLASPRGCLSWNTWVTPMEGVTLLMTHQD